MILVMLAGDLGEKRGQATFSLPVGRAVQEYFAHVEGAGLARVEFSYDGAGRRYDVALEVIKELPYRRWRDANPEDTLRFHALRLHEAGMIKSSPQKLLAQGADWRFVNQLKKELKA